MCVCIHTTWYVDMTTLPLCHLLGKAALVSLHSLSLYIHIHTISESYIPPVQLSALLGHVSTKSMCACVCVCIHYTVWTSILKHTHRVAGNKVVLLKTLMLCEPNVIVP